MTRSIIAACAVLGAFGCTPADIPPTTPYEAAEEARSECAAAAVLDAGAACVERRQAEILQGDDAHRQHVADRVNDWVLGQGRPCSGQVPGREGDGCYGEGRCIMDDGGKTGTCRQ